jgi:glycosyltransferase involved in cell wall biosynthesis
MQVSRAGARKAQRLLPAASLPPRPARSGRGLTLAQVVTVPMSFWLLRGQAARLARAGFQVHGVASPGQDAAAFSSEERVAVHGVPMARRVSPFADLLALWRMTAVLRRIAPHVVQAGTPKGGLLGTTAAWLLRVPVRVYMVQGLPMLTARGVRGLLLRLSERVSCAAATHVLCVSRSMRDELVRGGLCDPRKAVVLGDGSSNGVDTAWFDPRRLPAGTGDEVRASLHIPQGAPVVGFIGRVGREKGVGELAGAWQQVRERHPAAHLVIVGPREDADPAPAGALAALEADARVHFTGPDWDTAPLYAAFDICCLPSYREGLPNVPLEAAAMERPTVAFRVPGMVDAVEDGVTGRLVAPRDVAALAAALDGYLADPVLRERHGAAGRRRAVERFERTRVQERLLDFYLSLTQGIVRAPQAEVREFRRPARPSGWEVAR